MKDIPLLIILYGSISNKKNQKQQLMIDGGCTCGYREYAKKYGHIIYLSKQDVKYKWEHSITDPKKVIDFLSKYPDAVVWSVKHDIKKDVEILSKIKNKKLYYSCNSKNMYDLNCDVSLVDTENRINKNAKLWFKGKDPAFWKPDDKEKEFDYLLIGRRADKNELYFLEELNKIKEKRRVLWIGGKRHQSRIICNHDVVCTDFLGQVETRNNIIRAKVGILYTELKIEGFPQSFIEMTMCGLPVVYNKNGPRNNFYFHEYNHTFCSKENIINTSEKLLKSVDTDKCRKVAMKNYNLEKSYRRMLQCIRL